MKSLRAKLNTKESKIHTKETDNGQFPPRPLLLELFNDVIIDFGSHFGRLEGAKTRSLEGRNQTQRKAKSAQRRGISASFHQDPYCLTIFLRLCLILVGFSEDWREKKIEVNKGDTEHKGKRNQ